MEELTFEGAYNKNSKPAWKQAIALLIKHVLQLRVFD